MPKPERSKVEIYNDTLTAIRLELVNGEAGPTRIRSKSIPVDGDMVAVHTELLGSKSKPSAGGLRQVHLFRFGESNKTVEYRDITQMVQPNMPNAASAFQGR